LPFTLQRLSLSIAPLSDDITPQITVQVASSLGLPNGTPIDVDIDLNDDGDYDFSELDYASGTLFNNAATFQITPALPTSQETGGAYNVHVRARVNNFSFTQEAENTQQVRFDTTTSDVLKDYVNLDDGKFQWNLVSTIHGVGYTAYIVNMISQQWLTSADVSQSIWQHWVTVVVPSGTLAPTALFYIDGGDNTATPPTSVNPAFIQAALLTHSVVVDLPEVPNEPETFSSEVPGIARTEDQIIAYTFDQFMDDTSQTDWPALLPMTKAAVKGMDMVQQFIPTVTSNQQIVNFVVSGASKRGWTTWLTAAIDDRVIAIAPMVFDALNLDEQMVHHYGAYGFFSPAIQPYEDLHVFDRIETNEGQQLGQIVDPYRYLYDGRYNIPKMLIDSTGDQFFLPDSAQFYIHDLPGPTYLQYIPNTDHGLNTDAFNSVVTFYASVITGTPLPQYSWTVQTDGSLRAVTTTTPTQVLLWQATNPDARDFRKDYTNVVYTSTPLTSSGSGVYTANVPTPASGATAFFIEFTFPSPLPGLSYKFTTEIQVKTKQELFAWPFPVGDGVFDEALPLVAGGAPPAAGALLISTESALGSQSAAATAFATSSSAFLSASNSAPSSTQGIAAVVTTLQPATAAATPIVISTDEEGLQDPLLAGSTAGAGISDDPDSGETSDNSESDSDELFVGLDSLPFGRKITLG
jgi:PhoPQ-activated pathogenicity-related protein